MASDDFRVERDSMGELRVPADALWGAQTQRAVQNFPISGLTMPRGFIRALGLVKWAAAGANLELDELDRVRAFAIQKAALEVAEGRHDAHFPVDVFQTGSGTSSNMNANEVIARLASRYADGIAGASERSRQLQPEQQRRVPDGDAPLRGARHRRAAAAGAQGAVRDDQPQVRRHRRHVKTGRTHLMDAMPLTFGQELGAWRTQVEDGVARLQFLPAAAARARAGRHGDRQRHQCARRFRRPRRRAAVAADLARPAPEPRFLRRARRAGHRRRAVRPAAHARRVA